MQVDLSSGEVDSRVAFEIGEEDLLRAGNGDWVPVKYVFLSFEGEDTAMELLRQRFARGEIDAAEFEERKRALGG